jgi:hypothetical protein
MKTNIILIALFVAAFMFPSIWSFDTADAETDISHCANFEATAARPACEAAAHNTAGGNSGSNYNHLSQPSITGGVNGVESSDHNCAQFSGAPRTACEVAARSPHMGAASAAGMPGTGAPHMGAAGAAGMPGTGAPHMGVPGAAGS